MDALQISVLAVVSLFMLARPQTHTRAAVGVVVAMWLAAVAIVVSGWAVGDWAVTAVAAAGLALAYWAPPWLRADVARAGAIGPGSAGQDQQRADVGEDPQEPDGGGGGSAPSTPP